MEFGNCLRWMAIVAVMCFVDRTVCRTARTSYKFSRIPLDRGKHENYTMITPPRKKRSHHLTDNSTSLVESLLCMHPCTVGDLHKIVQHGSGMQSWAGPGSKADTTHYVIVFES